MGSDAPLSDIAEENKRDFNTVVRPIPQFDPDKPKMISQGPSICVFNKEDPQEVLASWLFAQFLLTNDIQIAYSKTEGYIPVTDKARSCAEYKEYLALEGTDSDLAIADISLKTKLHFLVGFWSKFVDASLFAVLRSRKTFITGGLFTTQFAIGGECDIDHGVLLRTQEFLEIHPLTLVSLLHQTGSLHQHHLWQDVQIAILR